MAPFWTTTLPWTRITAPESTVHGPATTTEAYVPDGMGPPVQRYVWSPPAEATPVPKTNMLAMASTPIAAPLAAAILVIARSFPSRSASSRRSRPQHVVHRSHGELPDANLRPPTSMVNGSAGSRTELPDHRHRGAL